MSQQVRVERELVYDNQADVDINIKGNPDTKRMVVVDEFWYDSQANYTVTLDGTSDAVAATVGGTSGLTLTTGTADNEISFIGTGLIFDITQKPVIEIRVSLTDVSGTVFFFGFSDANTETSPAGSIDADGGTVTAVATDAAGILVDADLGASSIYSVSVNTGGTAQSQDSALDWADGVEYVLRVALDASGNVRTYVNGVEEGYLASAVADVPLCAVINFGTRANDGSNTVMLRSLKMWQDHA